MELNSMQTDPKIQWHGLLDTTWDIISKFECNYQTLCLPLLLLSRDQPMTLCVSKPFVFCFLRRIHVYINSLSLGMCLGVVLHTHCPKHIPTILVRPKQKKMRPNRAGGLQPSMGAAKRAIHPSCSDSWYECMIAAHAHLHLPSQLSVSAIELLLIFGCT